MEKIIRTILLMSLLSFSQCYYYDPLQDVEVGEKDDYYFETDIMDNWETIEDAGDWIHENITYKLDEGKYRWQLPEETVNLKTGHCADQTILFMYFLKIKFNMNTYYLSLKRGEVRHAMTYPVVFDGSPHQYYYDATCNQYYENIYQFGWRIEYSIPYSEVMWMTYYYHRNVGGYY